jgi:hypothetical protein
MKLQEISYQLWDIFGARSKGWKFDADYVYAVEQILPKTAVGDLMFEPAIRRTDYSDLYAPVLLPANSAELPILKQLK